ncbi:MAG: HTH-type transcriptional regulator YhaJ [Burkholderia lata]|uniref:HTH-type transcriptional regulator YhaJ n=1 Tax=Burkholderia lata (strain ATCC 17760 / DSM 23089 / LMG 22485 / NCIMB 9086 / R18194 / 383) TaxID=482957 RepID=A0A833PKV3_BURL3|nr:MAG: HTH-type transcriptional regulator YhaJ [Burkholderia lata]
MKLSFEALEALDALDRIGMFAEAAELLHRVPSALTYLAQKLESDLDVVVRPEWAPCEAHAARSCRQ